MTKWVVFEAGSRAGLSALMFFRQYKNMLKNNDVLVLVDDDETFRYTMPEKYCESVEVRSKVDIDKWLGECVVFPADELTRQDGVTYGADRWFNYVCCEYYDKTFVNMVLGSHGVSVPQTMEAECVIVKPNSMSAGSKGIMNLDNYCIQQRIDVAHEYVVDMFVDKKGNIVSAFPREVKLRAGYDKYIRMLYLDHKVVEFSKQVVSADVIGIFRGPCHIQVVEDYNGKLYYIEGSKRISGTSLVNILRGYNPFMLLAGIEHETLPFDEDWHTYEELLMKAEEMVK